MIAISVLRDLAIRAIEWGLIALAGGLLLWTIHEERRDRGSR